VSSPTHDSVYSHIFILTLNEHRWIRDVIVITVEYQRFVSTNDGDPD
jgi:hypothetical protein